MNAWRTAEERGAAVLLVVLWLPVLLAGLSLVVNLGHILVSRSRLQAAADMAALAAVQSVDWDAMMEGEVRLVRDLAEANARDYAVANLQSLLDREPEELEVWVINAAPGAPGNHPLTGSPLEYPTVVVRVSARGPGLWLGGDAGAFTLRAEADASLRPRE